MVWYICRIKRRQLCESCRLPPGTRLVTWAKICNRENVPHLTLSVKSATSNRERRTPYGQLHRARQKGQVLHFPHACYYSWGNLLCQRLWVEGFSDSCLRISLKRRGGISPLSHPIESCSYTANRYKWQKRKAAHEVFSRRKS